MTILPTTRCAKFIVGYWIVCAGISVLCGPLYILGSIGASFSDDSQAGAMAFGLGFVGLLCLIFGGLMGYMGYIAYRSINQLRTLANTSH